MTFLLCKIYDKLRLWAVSPDTNRLAWDLNLEPVLGTTEYVTQAMRILDAVIGTRFDTLPERWRNRRERDSRSVGRVGPGADYFY